MDIKLRKDFLSDVEAAIAIRGMDFVYRLTPEAKASAKFKGGAND